MKKPLKQQVTIRLPIKLKEKLQMEAYLKGDSFNETVLRFIRKGFYSQ